MFVTATSIYFTLDGLKNLKPKDEVQISSGMGGSYTLIVSSVSVESLVLNYSKHTPSYLKKVEYDFKDALSDLYMLMPHADFGVTQQHIDIANKVGYLKKEDVISIVSKTANTYPYIVEKFLKQ